LRAVGTTADSGCPNTPADCKPATPVPPADITVRQPCAEIGTMAIAAMLERLRHPKIPPRDVLLDVHVVAQPRAGRTSVDSVQRGCYRRRHAWT
jgi:hypothetical protein